MFPFLKGLRYETRIHLREVPGSPPSGSHSQSLHGARRPLSEVPQVRAEYRHGGTPARAKDFY